MASQESLADVEEIPMQASKMASMRSNESTLLYKLKAFDDSRMTENEILKEKQNQINRLENERMDVEDKYNKVEKRLRESMTEKSLINQERDIYKQKVSQLNSLTKSQERMIQYLHEKEEDPDQEQVPQFKQILTDQKLPFQNRLNSERFSTQEKTERIKSHPRFIGPTSVNSQPPSGRPVDGMIDNITNHSNYTRDLPLNTVGTVES